MKTVGGQGSANTSQARSFGFVMAVLLALAAIQAYRKDAGWLVGPALAGGFVLTCLGLVAPRLLLPATRLWLALGHLLHLVVSPVLLGTIFFGVIAPIGLLLRVTGRRPLALTRRPGQETYWITCKGRSSVSMKNQF